MRAIHKLILLLQTGMLCLITACSDKTTSATKQELTTTEDTAMIRKAVQILNPQDSLKALYEATTIDGAAVGYAGVKTVRYKSFQWLVNKAPDSLLVALINHSHKYVSTYAFMALCTRNPSSAVQQIKAHLHDTTPITSFSGCIMMTYPLNEFWLSHLRGNISDQEYAALEKEAGINRRWSNEY